MPPTLTDIARETKTSVSTVSRVLAGGPVSMRIGTKTRERVREVANRLGYRPNLLARSLRTRKSQTIALLVSDIANPYFGNLASLIERSLHRHGYSLVLCNSGEDLEREQEYLRLLPQKGIDGLIVVPLLRTKKALLEHLPATLPVVVLDRPIPGMAFSVSSDPEQLTGLLCVALELAGVKNIALVSGPTHVITHRRRGELLSSRFKVMMTHEGPAQRETGRAAFVKFMELPDGAIDAIVCTNNFLGQGVIDAVEAIENPPIIGVFDEIPMMHLLPIPIAATVQDITMMAEECVNQLLPQLRGEATKLKPALLQSRAITNRAFQLRSGQLAT